MSSKSAPFLYLRVFIRKQDAQETLHLEALDGDGYRLDEDGNIILLVALEPDFPSRVTFQLADEKATFLGIKLAESEAGLKNAEAVRSTSGRYFEHEGKETSFKIASADDRTLELSLWRSLNQSIPLEHDWYFTVGADIPGIGPVWLDPRLHNKGEGEEKGARKS